MPKLFLKARDPISSYTHFIGLALSVMGTAIMLIKSMTGDFRGAQLTGMLFCLSLAGLYGASSLYHFVTGRSDIIKRLRKLDHSMIYILIAGTYTPLLYTILPAPKRYLLLGLIWGLALVGILLKLVWIKMPRALSAGLYILMGWFIAVDFPALGNLPTGAVILLAAGGLLYTAGGVIYAIKKPNISEMFGFHEIFHLFVIGGSVCHYLMVYQISFL